ncbi:hypothetical protein [Kaistia adipata]|uniref:hypothetical protein n=1 Tax=Kaistia adipata TaxID=166954 RepID=UPI000405070B|nr:hypothetical protein [Kaistia adipata]
MHDILDWLLINPARIMVALSIAFTIFIGLSEAGGKTTGGSGWLTLFRVGTGALFTLPTAVVAGIFGGIGAFFGYLLLQILVCIIIPMVWVDKA